MGLLKLFSNFGNKEEKILNSGRKALYLAVESNNIELVNKVISRSISDFEYIDTESDKSRGTALHLAIWNKNYDIAKAILSAGCPVDVRDEGECTPLHIAAYDPEETKMLRLLLDNGAKVNVSDNTGETPLLDAAYNGNLENVKALVQAGSDLNAKNQDGFNAIDGAISCDQKDVVSFLEDLGLNPSGNLK